MAKEWAKGFYNSKQWIKCRESYIASVYGQCEKCGDAGHILHHKETLTPDNINDHNISLNHEQLEYLCLICHNKEHGDVLPVADGFYFNSLGEFVEGIAPHQNPET